MTLIEVQIDDERAWLVNDRGEKVFERVFDSEARRWTTFCVTDGGAAREEIDALSEHRILSASECQHLKVGFLTDLRPDEDAAELLVVQPLSWRVTFDASPRHRLERRLADESVSAIQPILLPLASGVPVRPEDTLLLDELTGLVHQFDPDWMPHTPDSVMLAVSQKLKLGGAPPPGFLRVVGLRGIWADDEGAVRAEG